MSQARSNTGFLKGFWAPFQALRLILKSPKLLSLVAVPLAINICLYVAFFHYGAHYLRQVIDSSLGSMVTHAPQWAVNWGLIRVLGVVLRILSWLILALVGALTFTLVSGIVSAPFNDLLSKSTMRLYSKHGGVETRLSIGQTVTLEAKRMAILIAGALVAAIIGLIPFLQLPALVMGALLVAFEYFGYPISQRSSKLWVVGLFMLRNPLTSLGFGSFLLLIMALPFTSVLYIPLAVVGGTMLYADHEASLR